VSIATLSPPAAIYREEQFLGWAGFGRLFLGCLAFAIAYRWLRFHFDWSADGATLGVAIVIFLLLSLGVFRMTTEVGPDILRVDFGVLPMNRVRMLLSTVRSVEVVIYRPRGAYRVWGSRKSRAGERILRLRGDRGVRLTMADGSTVIVGSQRSEELARVIDGFIRTAR